MRCKDVIIAMAREAGLFTHKEVQPELARFADLVAAAEREECARVCEEIDGTEPRACAAAIRARDN